MPGGVAVGTTPDRLLAADGAVLAEAGAVVTAVGDGPDTEWLAGSGTPLDGGVVTDAHCRVAPGFVAAGDVVAVRGPDGSCRRSPHWSNTPARDRHPRDRRRHHFHDPEGNRSEVFAPTGLDDVPQPRKKPVDLDQPPRGLLDDLDRRHHADGIPSSLT